MLCRGETSVLFRKLAHLFVLAVKYLRDLYAREVLRKKGVYVGSAVLDLAISPSRKLAEYDGEQNDERHEAQHHKRKLVIDAEHGDEHADYDEAVFYKIHEYVREQHGNGVRIVRDARNKLADGHGVELRVREAFDVRKQIFSEFREDLLPRLLQDYRLKICARKRDEKDARIDAHRHEQARKSEFSLYHAFDISYKKGRNYVVCHGKNHAHADKDKAADIWLCIL